MSTVFSKNKGKRSRSSSNEANNSFVKNVTSKVSGLLPATIAKWFRSPSSSNANGSTPAADGTDSSTEDEESPIITQPPSKRLRYTSPGAVGKYNHFSTTDPNCMPPSVDTIEPGSSSYSSNLLSSPPGRTTYRRETNYSSTSVRSPNEETHTVMERSDRDNSFKSQHSVSNVGPSVATKRKSLFDTPSHREASLKALRTTANNTVVDPKAPCFKPSLFGSPFYPGRTMYGGASMYMNQPNIKQRKTAIVNESNSNANATMSSSARRVMDLLENYSSPLMEAKRISQYVKSPQNNSLNCSTISGSPYVNKVVSYKTQELHVPNIASILRIKQRSRLMETTNAARQIIASHSSTATDLQPYELSKNTQMDGEKDANTKLTTKVKSRLTRQNRGENIEMEEPMPPVNLPTGVLQIDKDNLPKFTFGNTLPSPVISSTPKSVPEPKLSFTASSPISGTQTNAKIEESAMSKPETVFKNDAYQFASPVRINSESSQVSTTPPKFTFGSPERSIDKPKIEKEKEVDPSVVVGTQKAVEKIASKDWQCPDCWVNNKPEVMNCVCCGAKQPIKQAAKAAKCTVCKLADCQANSEKCIDCDKVANNIKFPVLQPVHASNWKCGDCWVSNDENVDKCVCCGAKNPNPTKPKGIKKPCAPMTSIVASEWKCDDCWIKNKTTVDKCAACGAIRPGAKLSSNSAIPTSMITTMFGIPDNNMKNIAKAQSERWECTSCLVRNENNRTKCMCCESDKPGLIKESDRKSFNFGSTPNTSFKFGIDPSMQNSSSAKVPEVKSSESSLNKPEESETNNNVLPKTPSFSFGIPENKTDEQKGATKDTKTTETPKVAGFTFGITKPQSKIETPALPTFGSTTKLTDSVPEKPNLENEKLQEVPKVDFKFSEPKDSPKPVFGLTSISQENKDKVASPTTNETTSTEKKGVPAPNLVLQPTATSIQSAAPSKAFTFGGISTVPNIFAAPASTGSSFTNATETPAKSAVSMFQKPESTSAPSLSIFQKSDVTTTSAISLFQKNETTTTAALPTAAANAPVFSFGSNAAQSAAPPSFGSNTSQSAAPPSFGSNTAQAAAPPSFGSTTSQAAAPPSFGSNPSQSTAPPSFGSNTSQSANPPSFGSNATASTTPQTFGGNGIQTTTFGSNAQPAAAPQAEKPKFNFTFGGSTPMFNNTSFNATTDSSANKFSITGNNLGGNGLSTVNPLTGGNGLGPSKVGVSGELNTNPLSSGNGMTSTPNLFGTPAKENLWSTTNNSSTNLFVTSTSTNPLQKPATFTFGASTPFNSNNTTPAFGSNPAPPQNVFGMNPSASAQPTMFASPVQGQTAPSMFGSAQPASAPAPAMNLFGAPSVVSKPFGAPNPTMPSFEAPSMTPSAAPAFNFGAPQTSGVFGFGQGQQQSGMAGAPGMGGMAAPGGVYSFGGGAAPQVQFNMGSAPSTAGVRRVRKAVRRNPQR